MGVSRTYRYPLPCLGAIEPPLGFALRRGVKRYPEPMAHGLEACEPSHPLWPMAWRPVSRHTRAEAVDTGCQRDTLFSNPRNLESDF